jgi:hypothetical protein
MDTAKHKAPELAPEAADTEDGTGIFRRPGAVDASGRAEDRRRRHESARRTADGASQGTDADLEVRSLRASAIGGVTYDAKGDPVWEWRVNVPRRREGDPTIDLLKCLDVADLRLEDEKEEPDLGINPYDTARIRMPK